MTVPERKCDRSMTCPCPICQAEREQTVAKGVRGNPGDPLRVLKAKHRQSCNPRTGK